MDTEIKDKYQELNEILLSDIKVFFSPNAYSELEGYGIKTLGELFRKEESHELIETFVKEHPSSHELWRSIIGTINILKCKYLDKKPLNFSFNSISDIGNFFGIPRHEAKQLRYLTLKDIFKMVEDNNFSVIYMRFSLEKANELKNKFVVLYEYYQKEEKKKLSKENELQLLYEQLKVLVEEHQLIVEKIDMVKKQINDLSNKSIVK